VRRSAVVTASVAGLGALAAVWVLGMRNKSSPVVAAQRRINRSVFNPRQLESAGTPGAYAALVLHTGRKSGKPYRTPVGVARTGDGLVVALVYGRESDWVRNVLAAGSAVVVHEGHVYNVDDPHIVPMHEVAHYFAKGDRAGFRLLAIREALRLRAVDSER
jgi:deazaflavin-dependent oxidoreductase (nitroreductase family)